MKLKRIISALVVFTMVMTCAVCSVSADATYKTYTTYNVGTGEITVNAQIAGATDGSMVSYVIYGGDTVDETSVVHLDQATVNNGTAKFDVVTTDFDDFSNKKFQFVSTDDVITRYVDDGKPADGAYYEAVNTITDIQRSVVFVSKQTNAGGVRYYYIKDGVPYSAGSTTTNLGRITWDSNKEALKEYDVTLFPANGQGAVMPIEGVDAYMTQFTTKDGRDANHNIKFYSMAGNFAGRDQKTTSGTLLYDSATSVNMMIGGVYKEDITDGNFAGLEIKGGDMIGAEDNNSPGHSNASASYADNYDTKVYMTVAAAPVVGKYTNANGTFDAVTFLCAPAAAAKNLEKGLNIYRYELTGNSAEEVAGLELIASCPSPVDGTSRFGIQLFDGTATGELDATKYGFYAAPYIVIDGEKKELSVFGDNGVGAAPEEGQVKGDVFYFANNIYAATEVVEEPAE